MSRNKVPASVPTAPYTVTEGVFRVAASTEYYINKHYMTLLANSKFGLCYTP